MTREEAIDILWGKRNLGKKTREAIEIAIKALEQEPCEDCISRQAVLDTTVKKNSIWNSITNSKGENLEEILSQLPSVTPQPKIGHWIRHDTGHSIYYDCSRCGCVAPCTETADKWLWRLSNYCPDCGAKMENYSRVEVKNDF